MYLEREGAAVLFTGRQVRHGTHPMCEAATLEAGGPKPSCTAVHEFTWQGVYTCEESELTQLWHGTRARIQTAIKQYDDTQYSLWPTCQFVFRGAETKHGYNSRRDRTHGTDHQWIYHTPDGRCGSVWPRSAVVSGRACMRSVPSAIRVGVLHGLSSAPIRSCSSRREVRTIRATTPLSRQPRWTTRMWVPYGAMSECTQFPGVRCDEGTSACVSAHNSLLVSACWRQPLALGLYTPFVSANRASQTIFLVPVQTPAIAKRDDWNNAGTDASKRMKALTWSHAVGMWLKFGTSTSWRPRRIQNAS